ncbi:MAG: S-layer homology domain-containing protein [Clostridiales bacterium]|nr:S-layer homology domain-containing protein [Clostridiales bacterium]
MKYLKDIAVTLVITMLVSVLPVVAIAFPSGDDGAAVQTADVLTIEPADPNATPTASPTAAPEAPTDAPGVTDDPQQTPESSAEPTAEPEATAEPTANPTANPTGKHSVTVQDTEHSYITVTPTSAVSGAKVTVEGSTDRGYRFSRVYYGYTEDGVNVEKTLSSDDSHWIEEVFVMPASDVTIYPVVKTLSASEVVDDAYDQIDEVTELNSLYTSLYINNSTLYDSSDISSMRKYIAESKELIADLKVAVQLLDDAISLNDLTKTLMENVIELQTELDEVTYDMQYLAETMGGEDVDLFDMSVTVAKGGKVTLSGLVSGTVNATSAKQVSEFYDIETDGSTSLSFTITAAAGYSLTSFKINNKTVSVTGNKVTIKASSIGSYVKNGYMDVVASFSYSGFNSSGGTVSGGYGGGITAGGGTGTISGVTPTSAPVIGGFTDIADVEWAKEAILALSNLGIVNGMGDGVFAPQQQVTREQFAKMIVGVMGYSVDSNAVTEFSDANGDWYTPYIAAAAQNGLVTGREDGTFGVGDNITRQDMAVIIFRALGSNASEIHEFTDSADISGYAVEAVSALYNMGIISGYTDGSFGPKDNATRAEAAKMLYGVYGIVH